MFSLWLIFNHNWGKTLLNTLCPNNYEVFYSDQWEWESFLVLCETQGLLTLITLGNSLSGLKELLHMCLLISIYLGLCRSPEFSL